MIKANKGEWSEFYALVKILSEGKLFAADSARNRIPEKYLEVLNIIREEFPGEKYIYEIANDSNSVSIIKNGEQLSVIKAEKLKICALKIFDEIKNASSSSFVSNTAEELMNEMYCTRVKASSYKKEDLIMTVKDRISPEDTKLGFSVKSMLGGGSTLLNASGHTNFIYLIKGGIPNIEEINAIKTKSKIKDRINTIINNGVKLNFIETSSKKFESNLKMTDSIFPQMLSEVLLAYYQGKGKSVEDLVDVIEKEETLNNKLNITKTFFVHKMKEFLVAVALGMVPSKIWEGNMQAYGGYIIVKNDGDVVCYNVYNREEFKDYLYKNTYFDTPSSGRHEFGKIYESNGENFMNLNFQIRFKQ
ncbi:MAG: HpaII family restriction endonuclease [Candidatus Paceibacterota bacterium]